MMFTTFTPIFEVSSLQPEKLTALITHAEELIRVHPEVFDVILYGSTVLGKPIPGDTDLMIITRKPITPKEARNITINFKKHLIKEGFSREKLDIRAMSLEDLFDPNNLATLGLIIEGYSLTQKKSVAELVNGKAYTLFQFTLENLSRKDRVRFQYALKGRDMKNGLLKELNAQQLGSWVVTVPIQHTWRFKEFLDRWNVKYEAFTILKGADLFYEI